MGPSQKSLYHIKDISRRELSVRDLSVILHKTIEKSSRTLASV